MTTYINATKLNHAVTRRNSTTISRFCRTFKQASRFQHKLYNHFGEVELVNSPLFSEEGTYIWRVASRRTQ